MPQVINANRVYTDSSCNCITVERTTQTYDGLPLVVVRLVDDPAHGYLCVDEGTGGFGDEACPSSYGMPCLTWFGAGERHPDADAAVGALYSPP